MLINRYYSSNSRGCLDGVRILDLSRVLAGPFCSQVLGDMGAEVIKVESLAGDDTRAWGPPYGKNINPLDKVKESAYFLGINRNKKSISVNIKTSKGQEIIHKLAKKSEVLLENFVPGKLSSYNLGYEDICKVNPGIIYASITGYGPTGPYSQRAGYDVIIEGEAGLMHITGEEESNPVKVGVAITDITTGLFAHGAILAALYSKTKTGKGQKIDVSLLESQVSALANVAHNYLIGGIEAKRWGTRHSSIVPYQTFKTKDGRITIGAGNDNQFVKLCKVLEMNDLPSDERYKTNAKRVENRVVLIDMIEKKLSKRTTQEWLKNLETTGIPFGPVNTIKQTFEHPQVLHREMVQEVEHPRIGKYKTTGIPVKFSENKSSIRLPPPMLSEHTNSILTDYLDYSTEEVENMRESRIIG